MIISVGGSYPVTESPDEKDSISLFFMSQTVMFINIQYGGTKDWLSSSRPDILLSIKFPIEGIMASMGRVFYAHWKSVQ